MSGCAALFVADNLGCAAYAYLQRQSDLIPAHDVAGFAPRRFLGPQGEKLDVQESFLARRRARSQATSTLIFSLFLRRSEARAVCPWPHSLPLDLQLPLATNPRG